MEQCEGEALRRILDARAAQMMKALVAAFLLIGVAHAQNKPAQLPQEIWDVIEPSVRMGIAIDDALSRTLGVHVFPERVDQGGFRYFSRVTRPRPDLPNQDLVDQARLYIAAEDFVRPVALRYLQRRYFGSAVQLDVLQWVNPGKGTGIGPLITARAIDWIQASIRNAQQPGQGIAWAALRMVWDPSETQLQTRQYAVVVEAARAVLARPWENVRARVEILMLVGKGVGVNPLAAELHDAILQLARQPNLSSELMEALLPVLPGSVSDTVEVLAGFMNGTFRTRELAAQAAIRLAAALELDESRTTRLIPPSIRILASQQLNGFLTRNFSSMTPDQVIGIVNRLSIADQGRFAFLVWTRGAQELFRVCFLRGGNAGPDFFERMLRTIASESREQREEFLEITAAASDRLTAYALRPAREREDLRQSVGSSPVELDAEDARAALLAAADVGQTLLGVFREIAQISERDAILGIQDQNIPLRSLALLMMMPNFGSAALMDPWRVRLSTATLPELQTFMGRAREMQSNGTASSSASEFQRLAAARRFELAIVDSPQRALAFIPETDMELVTGNWEERMIAGLREGSVDRDLFQDVFARRGVPPTLRAFVLSPSDVDRYLTNAPEIRFRWIWIRQRFEEGARWAELQQDIGRMPIRPPLLSSSTLGLGPQLVIDYLTRRSPIPLEELRQIRSFIDSNLEYRTLGPVLEASASALSALTRLRGAERIAGTDEIALLLRELDEPIEELNRDASEQKLTRLSNLERELRSLRLAEFIDTGRFSIMISRLAGRVYPLDDAIGRLLSPWPRVQIAEMHRLMTDARVGVTPELDAAILATRLNLGILQDEQNVSQGLTQKIARARGMAVVRTRGDWRKMYTELSGMLRSPFVEFWAQVAMVIRPYVDRPGSEPDALMKVLVHEFFTTVPQRMNAYTYGNVLGRDQIGYVIARQSYYRAPNGTMQPPRSYLFDETAAYGLIRALHIGAGFNETAQQLVIECAIDHPDAPHLQQAARDYLAAYRQFDPNCVVQEVVDALIRGRPISGSGGNP